jgi:glycosyltransferase involved in cell wall biosynthesis
MRKLKVAISINTSWNIYNFRLGLVKALLEADHEVIAIAPLDNYTDYLKDIGCSIVSLDVDNTGSNPVKDIKLYWAYYNIYKKVNPDIILHFTIKPNIYGTLAARRLNIPVINNVSGLGTVFLNANITSFIAKQLYRLAFRKAELIFFQNEIDKQDFLKHVMISDDRVDLLPGSGINLNEFVPLKKESNSTFNFLMVSRILIDKGIYEYVEAARILKDQLKNVSFQLLGKLDENHKRGIPAKELKSWQEDGIIEYLGSTDTVEDVIKNADCVVLPSYREGTPRTLLEGAAMGKPLIATNVPGCNHVVMDGVNGFLCKVKNSESLANAMQKMYALDGKKRESFGKSSRSMVEEIFDEHIVVQKYMHSIIKLTN